MTSASDRASTPVDESDRLARLRRAMSAHVPSGTASESIAELQRTRDELRHVTAEQQAVIDTDLIGILRVEKRRIVWVNAGIEALFGYRRDELIGQSVRVLYPDEAAFEDIGRRAYRETPFGSVFRHQLQMMRKDGTLIWIDFSAKMTNGRPNDPLCMLVDITAHKRAEEIRLRTLALEAENRQLVEANRVKGLFLSTMSHELYTPLNAVIGFAHVLRSGAIDPRSPKFARYLGDIGDSGEQLRELIQRLLNFTDVESGRFDLRPEMLDLTQVLHNVIDIAQPAASARHVDVTLHVTDLPPRVTLDELRLVQVVSHLLANAIKFSRDGGHVVLRAVGEGAVRLRIDVEDHGIGIVEADLPRLFTSFSQLSEGNTKTHAGAGLSLALTRRLVEAQGGTVAVSSTPGLGSVFSVRLPSAPAPGVDDVA